MLGGLDYHSISVAVRRALASISAIFTAIESTGTVVFSGVLTPAQVTANQNDYSPAGVASATTLRISTDARRNITGLTSGASGRVVKLLNVGTFPAVFTYEDVLSTSTNRFSFGMTLGGGQCMTIVYDGTSNRWRADSMPQPIGSFMDFGGGTVPGGYLACDGTAVSRTIYAALFNEIGTTWGVGDGATTFNVPDSRRRGPVGSGGSGTATLANTTGSTGGAETHTITNGELPSQTYGTNPQLFGATGGPGPGRLVDSSATGTSTAMNMYTPSMVVTRVIKYA